MLKPRKQPRRLIRGKSSHYRLHFLGSSEALINLDQPGGTQLLKDTTPSIAWRRDITPAGTNPRTTPHLSPGGEILHLRAQIQGRLPIYRLEERYYTCGHKSKDDSPSIAWRRDITPAGTNPRTTSHLSPGGEILHLRAQIQGRLTIYRLEQKRRREEGALDDLS